MTLAEKLRQLRKERGWTQEEVAHRAGVSRGTISYVERGRRGGTRPPARTVLRLAGAFNVKPEELYRAAGYVGSVENKGPRAETVEDLLDRLRISCPQSVPVYGWEAFPSSGGDWVEAIEYVYVQRRRKVKGCLEGYIVRGDWVGGKISDGDIIIVDREGVVENGDVVACLVNHELHVVRVRRVSNELWLEGRYGNYRFEECRNAAVVIECIRRMK